LLYCIGEALKTNQTLREARLRKSEIGERLGKLPKHEREVFDRVFTGKPNKIIAYELDVSDRAVEIHRGRAIEKTQARSMAVLIRMHLSV
jgi:FixJ family two-component response regulator